MKELHQNAMRSVISITITGLLTSFHHIFRLGLASLPIWIPIVMVPIGLAVLFKRSRYQNRFLLGMYGLVSYAIIAWFGFVDGLFDHTFRVLGLPNITWLPGGDVEFVETAFKLGSAETSHWFFQITGSFAFIASLFALFFTTKFIMGRLAYDAKRAERAATAG
jgi:hypothetical protein